MAAFADENSFLETIQAFADLVAAYFNMLEGIQLIETPAFTLLDLMVGALFLTTFWGFINRLRAPKVTND